MGSRTHHHSYSMCLQSPASAKAQPSAQLWSPALCARKIHAVTLQASRLLHREWFSKAFSSSPLSIRTEPFRIRAEGAAHLTQAGQGDLQLSPYVYTLVFAQLPIAVTLCWCLPVYFPFARYAGKGRLCKAHLGWAAPDTGTLLLSFCRLPLGPSCESSVTISAEFHWHRPRKEANHLRPEGNKANFIIFFRNTSRNFFPSTNQVCSCYYS